MVKLCEIMLKAEAAGLRPAFALTRERGARVEMSETSQCLPVPPETSQCLPVPHAGFLLAAAAASYHKLNTFIILKFWRSEVQSES